MSNEQNRRSGRSTRQADELIQELFAKETIIFQDHAGKEYNMATKMLANKIVSRIKLEHPHVKMWIIRSGDVYAISIKHFEATADNDADVEAHLYLNEAIGIYNLTKK